MQDCGACARVDGIDLPVPEVDLARAPDSGLRGVGGIDENAVEMLAIRSVEFSLRHPDNVPGVELDGVVAQQVTHLHLFRRRDRFALDERPEAAALRRIDDWEFIHIHDDSNGSGGCRLPIY